MKPYPCFRPLLLVALVLFGSALQADQKTGTLDIHWIDSEGGGSTLIVTPAGESVLIDAGNPGGRDPARIIAAVKAAGLTRIDWFVLTHFHTDHFGGAAEVAAEIPLGGIWSRDSPEGDPDGRTPSQFPLVIKPFRSITGSSACAAPRCGHSAALGGRRSEARTTLPRCGSEVRRRPGRADQSAGGVGASQGDRLQ
jgi:hypothetical protein